MAKSVSNLNIYLLDKDYIYIINKVNWIILVALGEM